MFCYYINNYGNIGAIIPNRLVHINLLFFGLNKDF